MVFSLSPLLLCFFSLSCKREREREMRPFPSLAAFPLCSSNIGIKRVGGHRERKRKRREMKRNKQAKPSTRHSEAIGQQGRRKY
jgi:hypothetical protein